MERLKRMIVLAGAAILFLVSPMTLFAGGKQEQGILVGLALSDMSAPVFVQVNRRLTE
jgi:hypothetical protein